MAPFLGVLWWSAGCGSVPSGPAPTPTPELQVASEPPAPLADALLVPIGDHGGGVTVAEFQAAAARTPPAGTGPNGPELTLEQREQILDELVSQELLFQEAFSRGLYRAPKVKRAMVQQLLKAQVMSKVKGEDLPEETLRAYYEAHKGEFFVPEKAQVRRIFLRIDEHRDEAKTRELAQDLRKQLQADPARFKELAQEHSDDAYQRRGGDMGYVDRVPDTPHPPELIEKVFTIEVGRVSEPFAAGGGLNIVLVSARRDAVERPYEQVKGSVIRKLKSVRFEDASEAFVKSLEAVTPVLRPTGDALLAVDVDSKTGGAAGTRLTEQGDPEEEEP
jgi:peptidyl-prolyl cis-trans isomerase C